MVFVPFPGGDAFAVLGRVVVEGAKRMAGVCAPLTGKGARNAKSSVGRNVIEFCYGSEICRFVTDHDYSRPYFIAM